MDKKLSISKIAWDDENNLNSIVCIDKKTREELSVEKADPVKVYTKNQQGTITASAIAIVQPQFKDFIGQEKATVNNKLANKLMIDNGSEIYLSKQILESEMEEFKREIASQMFLGFPNGN